jgi:hypothetical protein
MRVTLAFIREHEAMSENKVTDELELIEERAARIPELARAVMLAEDPDEAYSTLRNVSGALQVLVTYLKEQ